MPSTIFNKLSQPSTWAGIGIGSTATDIQLDTTADWIKLAITVLSAVLSILINEKGTTNAATI